MSLVNKNLKWKGKQVTDKMIQAAMEAVDDTTANCVRLAKKAVPVITGTLQGSIEARPAVVRGNIVMAFWGSFMVTYAIWVEIGTSRMSGTPYLIPSADREYPKLARRIKQRWKALEKAA